MPRGKIILRGLAAATALIATSATGVWAQDSRPGVALSEVVGVWDYRATVGQAVVASVLTATATHAGWTIQHDTDPVIPVRIVTVAGDSVIFEAGPYASTLRPGQTVVRLRVLLHFHGDEMTGTFEAHYSSGDSVRGTADARRRK